MERTAMLLNKKQRIVLWVAGLIILGMCLYPPWIDEWTDTETERPYVRGRDRGNNSVSVAVTTRHATGGYDWIFAPPYAALCIDVSRLGTQCAIITLVAGMAIVYLGQHKEDAAV